MSVNNIGFSIDLSNFNLDLLLVNVKKNHAGINKAAFLYRSMILIFYTYHVVCIKNKSF